MEVILPITAGIVTWSTGVPGDLVALTLQNVPAAASTVTTISTTTAVSTSTAAGPTVTATVTATASTSTGFSATTVYGIAAVAVILAISTGYLAMRGRKPAS
jgi:hypothetical protein